MELQTLEKARLGGQYRIKRITERRLQELGLCEDAQITVLYECPFGGMRVYRIKSTRIAFRNRQAEKIWVQEVAG